MRRLEKSAKVGSERLDRILVREQGSVRTAINSSPITPIPTPLPDEPSTHRLSVRGWDQRSVRALTVVVAALLMIAGWWWWSGRANVPAAISEIVATGVPMPGGIDTGAPPPAGIQGTSIVVVHVAGEVRSPGLVELPPGSRVSDAVTAAGGALTPDALMSVNLARPVIDGEQIVLGGTEVQARDGRISINSASATELLDLPGVGPVLAERIVAFREQNGPFTSLDGLLEVSGIGESTLRNLAEQVRM
jgi:competence protein ComEA